MRILHISSARALGGGERHLADLANALAGRGHEVHAALAPRSPLARELTALPHENIVTLRLRNALDIKSALELASYVRRHRIEIVHAHMARDYTLASLAARRADGARLVITRHVLFPLHQLHAITLQRVARVIAVSQSVAQMLSAQALFPAHKISVVANGIYLRSFDRTRQGFSRDDFCRRTGVAPERLLVGSIGEIKPLKGHEEFLRAASIIARQRPDVDFIIAGQDTSRTGEHRAQVEHLIAELGLLDRVHLTGWLDDVAPLLCSLDLFISASHMESFGLTIVEAMASGAPVVATATDGAREIIEDDETGVLVPIGDALALAEAINALLEDADRRRRISARAREVARARFSLDQMVDATERIYLEALSAK